MACHFSGILLQKEQKNGTVARSGYAVKRGLFFKEIFTGMFI